MTSLLVMRLISVIEQMNAKLAIMEDRSAETKKDLMDRIDNLEKSLQSTEDKLCRLDSKLSAIDSKAIQEKVLGTMKTQIDNHFEKVLLSTERADDVLNKTAALLTTVSSNNKESLSNMMEHYENLFDNVTRGVDEILTRNRDVTDTMEANFNFFKHDVELSWQQLESRMNQSVLKTVAAVQNMTSEFDSTISSNMESALTDFFALKSCKKNTPVLAHPISTPYSGLYRSKFPGLDRPVLCDTITDGGGWIVIQRRSTGDVDFYRNWDQYKNGFGTFDNDFWLGNEKIHAITRNGEYELRVDLKYNGQSKYAHYDRFYLAGEDVNFALTVGSYSGTAGDELTLHSGHEFTTFDRDNDTWDRGNCAAKYTGAWWYESCLASNLNGQWKARDSKGLRWGPFTGSNSASFSEMKIRRVDL